MKEQPEALLLADAMSLSFPGNLGIDKAAAELRRLQALLEAEQALHQRVTYPELQRLRAQRDALLEALKLARSIIGHPDDAHTQLIDSVIKAAEENT